jgi:uncharacterized protein (TIGR03067 family)
MTRTLLTLLAVGVLSAADPPRDDATKKDLERLQGDWAGVQMIRNGVKVTDDEIQVIFRTIKGNESTLLLFDKALLKETFTIDATKKPKTIDVVSPMGPDKAKSMLGIYEIDDRTLKICLAEPGKARPTDFAAKAGSGHVLTVWEREKK